MTKIFETTQYEAKADDSIFSYSSYQSSNNGTLNILESFNEGEVQSWVLKGQVLELYEEVGESEFLLLLQSQASDQTYSEMKMKGLSIAEVKKHIIDRAESEGYRYNDNDFEEELEYLTEIIKEYPSPYFFCTVDNFGWRQKSGYKFVKITTGQEFVQSVLPNTDNSFSIYKEEGNALRVLNYHHDSPTGETYYIKNITLDAVIDLYSSGYDIDEILENSIFSELEKEGHERLIILAIEKNDDSAISSLLQYGVSIETDQGYKSMVETAFENDSIDALNSFLSNSSLSINEKIIREALKRTDSEDMLEMIKQHGIS